MLTKMKILKNNHGYIIAEAAILLPVFLFSVVLLTYMIKVMHFQEIIHFEASQNLVQMSWESQLGGDSFGKRMFESKTYHDVQKKVNKEIDIYADVSENDEVYTVEFSYPIVLDLPFGLFDDINITDTIVARKWSGGDTSGEVLGFEAMEHEDDQKYVFIFPRYGERYHEGGCRYLYINENGYIKCVSLAEAAAGGYTGCQVCH